ncbi:MAG: patatin-like phospholipase family protein [Pyrinomonadaceae bacterium]
MTHHTHKNIGLALSGGGARGFAHIGVLKVLVEHNIPIDMIAGTSAGSIIGGAYAAGMSVDELISMASKVGWTNMTRPSLSPLGLLSNAPMGKFLAKYFPVSRFEDLLIPFSAVACDFEKGEEAVFKDAGDLIFAIRASCAVPGVFAPLKNANGRLFVDGGVIAPMPTDAVRQMGAEIVFAVDLLACGATFRTRPRTAIGMLFQSAMSLLRAASRNQHYHADIVIEPQIAHLRPDEISKRDEFISLGEAAALEAIDKIKAVIESDTPGS